MLFVSALPLIYAGTLGQVARSQAFVLRFPFWSLLLNSENLHFS